MSKSNTVHISHNLLLIHQFYHDVSVSKYLKRQNKLKKATTISAFKMSTRTSITFFLSFHKLKMSPLNIFYPRQKVSGFPV